VDVSPNLKIKNIFGYNLAKSDDGQDYDGSPFPYFQTQGTLSPDGVKTDTTHGFLLRTRQISEELQLQGKAMGDRLDYVLGLYYLDQTDSVASNLSFFDFAGAAYTPQEFTYTAQWKAKSIAAFAQADYKLTDQLTVTGGFRWTHDKTTLTQLPGSVWLFTFPANTPEVTKASKPSWTGSLQYQVTPELMAYVATRGSWRAGGFNYSVQPIPITANLGGNLFLPETTKDVEIGIKYAGDSLGMPITFNADFFNQWVKNIQRAAYATDPVQGTVSLFTANVPKAEITGFEADFTIKPTSYLRLGASGNYTKARYTNNAVLLTLPGQAPTTVFYGPFADVPKFSGTAFAEVSGDVGNLGNLSLRLDVYGQTKMNFSNVGATLNRLAVLPSYTLVNGKLGLSDIGGSGISAAISARNIFNKKYYAGGNAANSNILPNTVNAGASRTVMGELRFDF
jgi:iron complex outermembrane receptor protein